MGRCMSGVRAFNYITIVPMLLDMGMVIVWAIVYDFNSDVWCSLMSALLRVVN